MDYRNRGFSLTWESHATSEWKKTISYPLDNTLDDENVTTFLK